MKILNICGYSWDIGGPPKIIYDHAVVQLRLGAEVTILTPISEGQQLYAIPEGAKVVTCKRHWFADYWAEFSPELYKWIKIHGNEFDLIHIHGIWHFAGIAPYLAGIETAKCITIHGLLDHWTMKKGLLKKTIFGLLFQKKILKNTQLIQINNIDEQADLRRFLGFDHPNVKIIPNGMNLQDFSNLPPKNTFRDKFKIRKGIKIILFMSRINLKKGLDILLPAYYELRCVMQNTILIIAGPDDGFQEETEAFIEKYYLKNEVLLVGMLTGEDKLAALSDADIFVLPSYSEGFSIATLEALISGVPSLLSERVGFAKAIKETNAAHLVQLTPESIFEGLIKMVNDEEYCKTLSQNGKDLVKDRYDIERVAIQLYQEFEKLGSNK